MSLRALGWSIAAVVAVVAVVRKIGGQFMSKAPTCSREYAAFNHGGPRALSRIAIVVLHSTEGGGADPTARSTASWFAQRVPIKDGGPFSAHVVVGPDGCFRVLSDDVVAYGAGEPANTVGLHIEQAGHAAWTRAQWLAHQGSTIALAAACAAAWCEDYGIPVRFLDAAELRRLAGLKFPPAQGGITTHAELSKAFPKATTHTDPGKNYPLDVFFELAGGSLDGGGGAVA